MSLFPLDLLLGRLIQYGRLTVIGTDGSSRTFAGEPGPSATIRLIDDRFRWQAVRSPALALGEGYMDGAYRLEDGTLRDFLDIMLESAERMAPNGFFAALLTFAGEVLGPGTGIGRARTNVAHHYDIDHRLYRTFLDEDMQYSCAYWRDGVQSLEEAQVDKKRHIAAKLLLKPGMRVLDIGSGWGGLAMHLAREHGADVTGVTLSTDQHETATRRAAAAGLSDRVRFKLQDYRHETEAYDRIVSVGMFEHVGRTRQGEFFDHVRRLLKPTGVALIHTIARMTAPYPVNAWTRKYIFPGGYLPTLSQLSPVLERRRLWLTDLEVWRLHYARTLREWDRRFQAHRAEMASLKDERFCRMWEFYLQSAERSFHRSGLAVFQMQVARELEAVPLTRDYIYADRQAGDEVAPARRRAGQAATV